MKDIDRSMEEFLDTVSNNFNSIITRIDGLKDNMVKIKQETKNAKQELIDLQRLIKTE